MCLTSVYPDAAFICTKCTGRPCLQRQVNSHALAHWPQTVLVYMSAKSYIICCCSPVFFWPCLPSLSTSSLQLWRTPEDFSSPPGLLWLPALCRFFLPSLLCSSPVLLPHSLSSFKSLFTCHLLSEPTLATFLKTVIYGHLTLTLLISIPLFPLCYLIVIILPSNIVCDWLIFAFIYHKQIPINVWICASLCGTKARIWVQISNWRSILSLIAEPGTCFWGAYVTHNTRMCTNTHWREQLIRQWKWITPHQKSP